MINNCKEENVVLKKIEALENQYDEKLKFKSEKEDIAFEVLFGKFEPELCAEIARLQEEVDTFRKTHPFEVFVPGKETERFETADDAEKYARQFAGVVINRNRR